MESFFKSFQEYARRIARVTKESKLEIDEDKYVESFKPHLMDVVHAWCTGASFAEILKKTDVFEGIIKHCFYINTYMHVFLYICCIYACAFVCLYICMCICDMFYWSFCAHMLRTVTVTTEVAFFSL